MFGFKARRRRRLRTRRLPDAWRRILARNVPVYAGLPDEDRRELEGHVQVLLAEKAFEGAGGLEITDEIRVTIAGHACLLLLHRDTDYYPALRSVVVYPTTYWARSVRGLGPGLVAEGDEPRAGESWHTGAVVLSWDEALATALDLDDGRNVILHEFAHQLDQEDRAADGAPILDRPGAYATWARVLGEEYARLRRESDEGRTTVLDAYGGTDPAEFFAVATEAFFERPRALKHRHPELYAELERFYRQDPARIAQEAAERYPINGPRTAGQ